MYLKVYWTFKSSMSIIVVKTRSCTLTVTAMMPQTNRVSNICQGETIKEPTWSRCAIAISPNLESKLHEGSISNSRYVIEIEQPHLSILRNCHHQIHQNLYHLPHLVQMHLEITEGYPPFGTMYVQFPLSSLYSTQAPSIESK